MEGAMGSWEEGVMIRELWMRKAISGEQSAQMSVWRLWQAGQGHVQGQGIVGVADKRRGQSGNGR